MTGLPVALICFIIGYFPHVHWSSYLLVRTFCIGVFTIAFISLTDGWVKLFTVEVELGDDDIQPLLISVVAATMVGVICNIYRIASVYACQEMELFDEGMAGTIGNVLNTAYIAITAFYSYLFFGEVMSPMALIGAASIGCAILFVTGIKIFRRSYFDEKPEKIITKKGSLLQIKKGKDEEDVEYLTTTLLGISDGR